MWLWVLRKYLAEPIILLRILVCKLWYKTMFTYTMVVYLWTRWKLVLPHLYKLLSQSEFIQSDSNASWQKYQKVILLSQKSSDKGGQLDNEHTQSVLLNSLILAGVNAAILPDHLTTVLTAYIRYDSIPGYLQRVCTLHAIRTVSSRGGGAVLPKENGKKWDILPKVIQSLLYIIYKCICPAPKSSPQKVNSWRQPCMVCHADLGLQKINMMFCRLSWNTTYVLPSWRYTI